MNRFIYIALAVLFPLLIVAYEAFYTVNETEQVIMTQFGKPVGGIVNEAGLKLKIPFIQKVNRIEKRILLWDGSANDMPTKDKLYITVDTFGRWRIKDPLQYFLRLRDERSAQSRLEDILGSETRNAVAKHELIEIVRFKRINYNESVRQKIYARMISERQQIAERFRSEGAGEAAKIIGNKEKDLQRIESEAYRKIQSIQGVADAKATEIYAAAYNQTKSSRELYDLVKTLETIGLGLT